MADVTTDLIDNGSSSSLNPSNPQGGLLMTVTPDPELLRRAAERLREHAKAASTGPWTVTSYDHPGSDDVEYAAIGPADEHGTRIIPFRTWTEDAGHHSQAEADITYGVLMHPPLALAFADLLQVLSWFPSQADPTDLTAATVVAREVLRSVFDEYA